LVQLLKRKKKRNAFSINIIWQNKVIRQIKTQIIMEQLPQRLQDKITRNMEIVREKVGSVSGINIDSVSQAYLELNLSVIGNLYNIFGSYDSVNVLEPTQFVNDCLHTIKYNNQENEVNKAHE
jgi:hypothetical protein